MKKNKRRATGSTVTAGVVIGIASALAISLLMSLTLTSFAINGSISEDSIGIYIFAIRMISTLLGGLIGTGITKGRYIPVIGLITGGILVVLLGWGIVFYDGRFQNVGSGVVSVLIGGVAVVILKLRPTKKRGRAVRITR